MRAETEFMVGDRVKVGPGHLSSNLTYTIVTPEPDVDGDVIVLDSMGRFKIYDAEDLIPCPKYPVGFQLVFEERIGYSWYETLSKAREMSDRLVIGIIEYRADGTTTMHEKT
jgi:hypothetical protein